jgi:ribonuclease HI
MKITVQNILNKQFGKESVTRIADEYGNEWFEISLDSPKVLEQTSNIKFQAPNIEYTGDLAIEEKMAELSEEVLGKGYVAKNWFEKILQDIWNWIQDLVNPKGEIEKLFRNINQGRIKGKVKIGSKKYQQKEPYKKLSKPIVQHLDMLAAFELWQHDSFAKFLNDEIKTDVLIKEVKSLLLKENLSIKDPALKEEIDNLIENWEDIYPLWIEQSSLFDFSEITENEDEENTGFQERTEQKLSSLEQADRWARAFIHTIPSIEMKDNKPVRNSDGSYKLKRDFNGLLVPANYTTLWNVIADIAEGSLTVDEIVQKLEQGYPKIHEIYIVKDRLNQLFPYTEQGRRVRNLTDALLLKSLEKSFAKVLVPTVILKGKSDENGQIDYQVIQSDRIDSVVISNYITSLFRQYARTHDLVLPEGFVDHKKLLEDLNRRFGTSFEKEAIIKFWEELGIFLPETSIRQHGVGVAAMTAFTKSLVKKLIPLQQIESDELKMDFDLFDFLNRDHNINGVISSSESYTAKRVRTRLAEILPFATSNMTKNAEGENQSNLHNFSTWLLNIKFLNEGAFDRIGRASNPMFKRSKIVNLLKQGKKIEPVNLSGTSVEYDEVKGQNSINLDAIDYVRQEMHTMYLFGSIENIRAETASSSFGYRIEWDDKRYTPLPNYNSRGWAKERFIEYLKGELERIWSETNRPSAYTSRFYNTNKGEFSLFKDIFPNEYQGKKPKEFILNQLAKVESVDRVEDLFTPEFKQSVEKYLDLFFDKSVNDFKQWMFEESGRPLTKNHPVFHSKNLQDLIVDFKGSDNLIENFILNSLIFKVEEIIVFHGELALFDKFFKRSKSPISNGTSFIVSNSLLPVVASYTGKPFTFSEAFGVKPNYLTDTKNIKSIVLKEDEIGFRGNIEDWTTSLKESVQKTLNFFNKEVSQDTIDEQVKKIISGYDKSVVSDGEGFVHPDAYRLFLIGVNSWTKDMETGYLYLAAKYRQSKGVDIGNQIKFIEQVEERIKKEGVFFQFPKLKFQYRGHATSENNTNIAVELLDKFALTPLFPDMVEGSLIGETLLSQMSKQSIAYGKFESGTKLMSFPPDGISGLLEQVKNGDVIFTSKHTIDSVFLKEQVKTPHKVKTESIFGSQSRKLILSNLSLEGNFMPEVQDGVDKWINGQREVAAIERKKILKELGASENIIQDIIPEGQETQAKNALENVTIDLSKLIDMVKKEADKRDLPESVRYVIDNFDTLSETHLETSLSPQNINTLIYSILKNRIVKVKYPGAQFVQVASSLFSKGERDLNFYRPIVKDGKTIILPADCKISMSGDFLNLLNLKEVGDGTIFEKTKQLNELLKDETFREKHQEVLTVFAYRIPTQGFNSMDILMVKEFLPPYTANTIIPPPEITVKSGADYDYDKMVVVTPSIDRSGKFIKKGNEKGETVRLEILYDKLFREFSLNARILMSDEMQRALALFGDDTVEIQSSLIRDGQLIEKEEFIKEGLEKFAKKAAYNDAITGARAILLNPVNFHRLVTPNDTEIIKAELNKILQPLYDTTGKVNVEPSHTSIVNPVTSYKKWSAVKIKDLLGIGAVANTFYTLMQVANVKTNESLIINKVPFYFNLPLLSLEQQEKVNLSDPFVLTKDGSVIDKLEYINQFINLTVDAASDDIAGYSNMILDNTGYIMFMVMLGHPFETVLQLIHQPIIYRYHQIVRTHKSLGKSPNDAQKEALQELLDISSVSVNQYGIFPKSNEKIWKEIRDSFSYHNEIKLKNIQPLSSHRSIKDFSVRDKEVLTYYLIGLKEAEALRELQSFNNFDTSTSPSYKMSTLSRSTKNIKGTGLFDLSDAIKIHTESVISHLDVHDLFGLLSTQAFPILNSQPFAKKVVALAGDVYGDVEKFIRVMDNDFLLFIVQNFGDYAEKREKIEDLLSKGKLMSQWTELTNKYPSLKDFYLYKKLIEVPSKNSDFIHPSFFMGMDNQAEDFNQIIKELRQLLNSSKEDVRMFAENLIEVGFYQSGYNSSKLYMLKGFPPEYVYKMTKPAFDKFFNLSRLEEQEYVNIFEIMFLKNRVFEFGKFFSSQYKDMGTSVDAVKVNFSRAWYDLPQYLISSSQKDSIQDKKEYAESLKNKETEYAEFEEISNKADTIYSQLGDKTQSGNVVIKPWSELEDTKEAVVNNQKNIKYTYQDFANDNKGIKVLVQYDKYEKPFEALITGEVEEVGSGNDENGNYKYVGVQVKSNTGKLLTVNPFFEITGNVKNQDKLTNESNVIRETESISSKENPIIVYVDGSDIKGTGNIGFGVNTTQNNKEYSISGAFDTNDLSLLEKDLGVKLETKPSNAVMEFYGSLVALRNTPKNEFITIKQDLEGVQLWILSGLMEKLSKQNLDSKKKYDIWYKSLSEEQKQEYYNRIQNLIGLDKSLISKFDWDGRKGFYAEDKTIRAIQQQIINLILERKGKIQYQWVKGHSGEIGNEKVDVIAKDRNGYNTYKELFTLNNQQPQIVSTRIQGSNEHFGNPFDSNKPVENKNVKFEEEQTTGYRNRTIKNASADATIAIAVDFNSAGEKLTKSSVLGQSKKYISLDANNLTVTQERVDKIVEQLNSVNAKTLNIAGNGIYTMKGKYTQQQVDDFTYELLNKVLNSPNLKTKIESIRSGGQTGFDEAGTKAGIRLGLPTLTLAPKGWTFRNSNGQDISNEQQFKARFENLNQSLKPIVAYRTRGNNFLEALEKDNAIGNPWNSMQGMVYTKLIQ